MSSIGVDKQTKEEWDELKPEELTHDEFAQHAIDCIKRDNGEVVNVDELVSDIKKEVAAQVELAAYRGTKEALENHE